MIGNDYGLLTVDWFMARHLMNSTILTAFEQDETIDIMIIGRKTDQPRRTYETKHQMILLRLRGSTFQKS